MSNAPLPVEITHKHIAMHQEMIADLKHSLGELYDPVNDLCEATGITKRQLAFTIAYADKKISMKDVAQRIYVPYGTIRRWPEIAKLFKRDKQTYHDSDED